MKFFIIGFFVCYVTFSKASHSLMTAVIEGSVEKVKHLADSGENIHARYSNGSTLLHWAAELGHSEMVLALVQLGIDVHTYDNQGKTPIDWAVNSHHQSVIPILMKYKKGSTDKSNPFHRLKQSCRRVFSPLLLNNA